MNSKEVLILYALLIFMRTKWSFMRTQKLLISINQWILFPTKQVWIGFLPLANSFLEPPTNILIYSILLPLPKHCLCYLSSQFLTFPMTNPQPPIFFLFISLERCGETLEYVQFDLCLKFMVLQICQSQESEQAILMTVPSHVVILPSRWKRRFCPHKDHTLWMYLV